MGGALRVFLRNPRVSYEKNACFVDGKKIELNEDELAFWNKLKTYPKETDLSESELKIAEQFLDVHLACIYDTEEERFKNYPAPYNLFVELTERCNFKCKHCFANSGTGIEMDLDLLEKIAREAKDIMVESVVFSGGEPTTYSHLEEAFELFKDYDLGIVTNGSLINDHLIGLFKKYDVSVVVSVHGPKEFHNEFTQTNAYDLVMNNVKKLVDAGLNPGVQSTLNTQNIDFIPKLLEELKRIGVKRYGMTHLIPVGRGIAIKENTLTSKHWTKVKELYSYIEEQGFEIRELRDFDPRRKRAIAWCAAGTTTLDIYPNGDVYPCAYIYYPWMVAGNVKTQTLKDIWLKSKLFKDLRFWNKGPCSKCMANCLNCRAMAYGFYGSFEAKDPRCGLEVV